MNTPTIPRCLIGGCAALLPVLLSAVPKFKDDLAFLEQHVGTVVLREGAAAVAVVPAYQGRVMTSSFDGEAGPSCGWINRPVIAQGVLPEAERTGKLEAHIHVFGGEERLWLGPEGGQFALFFPPGAPFEFEDWKTPALIDTEAFPVVRRSGTAVSFARRATLTNWQGAVFDFALERTVEILDRREAQAALGVALDPAVELVAYRTTNTLRNRGRTAWTKRTGLLSLWMLGMYPPSPDTIVAVPFRTGSESELGPVVNADYFGRIPDDRLRVADGVLYFKGDGKSRGKLGLSPRRSLSRLGSYAADTGVMTLVICSPIPSGSVYVNSTWEMQDRPFGGDAVNAYNDGPPTPGAAPLGPFHELETSSPAAELAPGESLTHVQTTVHLRGETTSLDGVAREVLRTGLDDIVHAFSD